MPLNQKRPVMNKTVAVALPPTGTRGNTSGRGVRTAAIIFAVMAFGPARPAVFGQDLAELTQPPAGNDQKAEVSQWIGPVKITIAYHSRTTDSSTTASDRCEPRRGEPVQMR